VRCRVLPTDHRPGLINVDFADVRTVMAETAWMMGSGSQWRKPGARAAERQSRHLFWRDITWPVRMAFCPMSRGMDLSIGIPGGRSDRQASLASEMRRVVVGTVMIRSCRTWSGYGRWDWSWRRSYGTPTVSAHRETLRPGVVSGSADFAG